jgi:hypothetical protein
MGATSSGLPYPDPGSSVDVPRDIRALAEAITATGLTGLQFGSSVVTLGGVTSRINFPRPYVTTPVVVAVAGDGPGRFVTIVQDQSTPARFEFAAADFNATITSGLFRVNWCAFGVFA